MHAGNHLTLRARWACRVSVPPWKSAHLQPWPAARRYALSLRTSPKRQDQKKKNKKNNINTQQHHERKSRAGKVNFLAAFPAVFSTLPPAACQPPALSLSVTSAARSATEPGTSAPEADPMTSPRSPGSLRRWIELSVLIITIVF